MDLQKTQGATGTLVVVVALAAGALTWLCVGWFGDRSLLTAFVAVVLVEVCLASFGVILMLLAERMTVAIMTSERRPAASQPARNNVEPIWIRLHDPVVEAEPHVDAKSEPTTIVFPSADVSPADGDVRRRAA